MIKLNLETNGYFQIKKNFFNLNENILKEFNIIYRKYPSEWQNVSTIDKIETIHEYQGINQIYKKILDIIDYNLIKKKLKFDDIWFGRSKKIFYKNNELPNIPHIDKIRKFKIMIYLNAINIDSGPLFIANCNTNKYEELRLSLKKNYKKNQDNLIKDIPLKDFSPMIGEFGSTIFFDTNTPHFAGPFLNENNFRNVIRFNFRYI